MQHKTIIATCAAMAAFSGMATADIQLPLDVLNANNGGKTFSAQLGAGYATKYISRGLAFQNSARDRKSTRLNSSHIEESRMPSSA